jgi:hypothetical protein
VIPKKEPAGVKARKPHVAFDARRQDVFLDAYRTSGSHAAASKSAGVTRKTVYAHMSRDPEFKAKVLEARTEIEAILADELIRRSLVTTAKGKDTTALIFALKNQCPARWADRRQTDHTSSDRSMPFAPLCPKGQEERDILKGMFDTLRRMRGPQDEGGWRNRAMGGAADKR